MIHLRYLLLTAALCLASHAGAQCRGCSAPTVAPLAAPARQPSAASGVCGGADQIELIRLLSRRIDRLGDQVREMRHSKSGAPCVGSCSCGRCGETCPCRETAARCGDGCACVVGAEKAEKLPTGVVREKLSEGPRYTLDGKDVTHARAMQAIGDDRIPDDAGKLKVVVAGGTDAQRRAVLDDLAKAPAALAELFTAHAYDASSPLVKDRGYVASGSPSITVMAGDGKVIGRNLDGTYRGAQAMYAAIGAAAKYDPAKDRDLWSQGGGLDAWIKSAVEWLKGRPGQLPGVVWLLGVGAVLMLLVRRDERKR